MRYLSNFDESTASVLFHIQIESLALNLQHFGREFLLALLALLTCNQIELCDKSGFLTPIDEHINIHLLSSSSKRGD